MKDNKSIIEISALLLENFGLLTRKLLYQGALTADEPISLGFDLHPVVFKVTQHISVSSKLIIRLNYW